MLWIQSGPDNASPQSPLEIMGESLLFKWTTRYTPLRFASNLGWQRNVTPAANSLPLKNGRLLARRHGENSEGRKTTVAHLRWMTRQQSFVRVGVLIGRYLVQTVEEKPKLCSEISEGTTTLLKLNLHRNQSCSRSLPYYLSPEHLLIVVPEVSAGHAAVAVHAGATDGIMHGDLHGGQALLGILRDAGRVVELLLRLLGRPLPLLLVTRRGVHHHGSRSGHRRRLLSQVNRRELE